VTSSQIAYSLQTTPINLPLDQLIHGEFGDIVHEGRCQRDFVIVDHVLVIDGLGGVADVAKNVSSLPCDTASVLFPLPIAN
jgi:hypothetical protein